MTKEREALKLALVAFEEINKLSVGENAICLPAEIDTAMDAIKQVLAQPEQEPVANISIWHKNGEQHAELWNWGKGIEKLPDGEYDLYTTPPHPEPVIDKSAAVRIATALGWEPKREFVGLTDEEIILIVADCASSHQHTDIHFARAIEAKLKEKNNG